MAVDKAKVLQAAAQLERDGQKFYLDAASKASNELAAKMLKGFAADEQKHIEWIEELAAGSLPKVEPPAELYRRLRGIFADAPEALRGVVAASQDDIQAIQIAKGMEDKSVAAYEQWAREADDEGVRKLCSDLAQFERHHRQVLENTAEYLEQTGDWFMEEEGWMFDGG